MSFYNEPDGKRRRSDIKHCGNSYISGACGCSEEHIPSCNCQSNIGYLDRSDCGNFRCNETVIIGAHPEPCQCVEEEIWNSNVPPKPNCQWLNNFVELRRQWSDHGRQQAYKCCSCQPCRTTAPCRLCLPPTSQAFSTTSTASDCQKCCKNRRLAGGASKSEITSVDKSSSPERPWKREAGGGCPLSNCSYTSTRCNSTNVNYSATSSSCCSQSPQCRCSQPSSYQVHSGCQSCAVPLKSILKKNSCCQYDTSSYCICQPMPRNCNCPLPIQVDIPTDRECSCDYPSKPECACPPSERRFPKTVFKCTNTRPCSSLPPLTSNAKCHGARCQSCLLSPCNLCMFTKCQSSLPSKNLCRPCSPCAFRRTVPPASTELSCHSPIHCRKSTFCTKQSSQASSLCTQTETDDYLRCDRRTNVTSAVVHPVGVSCKSIETSEAYEQTSKGRSRSAFAKVFSDLGGLSYSILMPSPLALVSFAVLILLAITWTFGLVFYRHYLTRKKLCWKYLGL